MRFKSWVWMTNMRAHPDSPDRIAAKNSTFDPNETSKSVHFIDGPDKRVASELHESSKSDAIVIDGKSYAVSRHWDFQAKVHYTDGASKSTEIMAIRVGALKSGGRGPETGKIAFRLHDLEVRAVLEGDDSSGAQDYTMESLEEIEITKFLRTYSARNVGALRSQLSLETIEEGRQGWNWDTLPDDIRALIEQGAFERANAKSDEASTSSSAGDSTGFPSFLNRFGGDEGDRSGEGTAETTQGTSLEPGIPSQDKNDPSPGDTNFREGRNLHETSSSSAPVCFTKGTMILTDHGEIPVEQLKIGDLVMTKDRGLQPIRWIGRRELGKDELADNPNFLPIRISADAFEPGVPARDLCVSPQHRIYIQSSYAEKLTGSKEVLVPAKKLGTLPFVQVVDEVACVSYYHILLDQHELIYSNGALAESFYLSEYSMKLLTDGGMDAISGHILKLRNADGTMLPARPFVAKNHEIQRLILEFKSERDSNRVH